MGIKIDVDEEIKKIDRLIEFERYRQKHSKVDILSIDHYINHLASVKSYLIAIKYAREANYGDDLSNLEM